ncbi:hypothetical protein BJ912DRAFT_1061688 [Pholiota molesta]|nr:hypothetical protein BJ912DRAFT_1061688 [Pholiota molesta]
MSDSKSPQNCPPSAPESPSSSSNTSSSSTTTESPTGNTAEHLQPIMLFTEEQIIEIAKICVSTRFGYLRQRGPRRVRDS